MSDGPALHPFSVTRTMRISRSKGMGNPIESSNKYVKEDVMWKLKLTGNNSLKSLIYIYLCLWVDASRNFKLNLNRRRFAACFRQHNLSEMLFILQCLSIISDHDRYFKLYHSSF